MDSRAQDPLREPGYLQRRGPARNDSNLTSGQDTCDIDRSGDKKFFRRKD